MALLASKVITSLEIIIQRHVPTDSHGVLSAAR
jgi:hypothetical protein